ncbi:BsuPI-related putative proteinase inhibitor [Natrialbaceae archaeon GCM10025810]|uniref:BsuPI-related putative proteinase inhibitor n=1 Tax=Halovalidus salilacus TaxID=3075124 RepID=UPI00361EE52D
MALDATLEVHVREDGDDSAGDPANDERGRSLEFAFTVANGGSEAVDLRFPDACRAEFVVSDGDSELWRSTQGRVFAQVLTTASLPPGEALTIEDEWSDPSLEPGTYDVVAKLRARENETRDEATVTVA